MEQAGVQLVAQGADKYAGDLRGAERATASFVDGTDKAAKGVSTFAKITTGASERVGHAVVDFAGDAARALIGFASDSLNMAGDYEQSMNVLQQQSGASAAEMDAVRATAKALGADLTLPATSAVDAGNAMLELSKGGLELDDAMAAAKGTLQLAAAAETDVATAANITTGALKAFGLEGDKATYIADLMANAANQSRASITDLAQGFQQAAFRMKSAGQGADDLAASLAILTNNGLSGSDAGTALQNAIARLQGPTDKAAKLMADLSINVYDAQGNMKPMRDIIAILNDKLGGMTQQQRNAALQTIFLSDGMKAMIPLMDAGADGFDKMKAAVNQQGAAAALAEAQTKGYKGAIAGLQSQVETLALEALEPLLPVLTEAIQGVALFAGSLVGRVGPAVTDFIGFMREAANFVADNAVPALAALGTATVAYAVSQLPLLFPVIAKAVIAFGTQAAAMTAALGPFALLGAAIFLAVKAYQASEAEIQKTTLAVLNNNKAWLAAVGAQQRFDAANDETKAKLTPYAETLKVLQERLQAEQAAVERANVSTRDSAGVREMARQRIASTEAAILKVTEAMERERTALQEGDTAKLTATATNTTLGESEAQLQQQTALTAEQLEKLATEFYEVMAAGQTALGTLATTHATFTTEMQATQATHTEVMAGLQAELESAQTEEQRKGIKARMDAESEAHRESLASAARAYAEQAAAQRQALGEQLLAYIENQRQMGNISDEKAAEIREKTITHFGVMRDSAAALFGEMAQSVDQFAQDAGASAADVTRDWGKAEDAAVELRIKANELKDKYVMEIMADFDQGRITVEEARKRLAAIPARVESEIVITETRKYRTEGGNTIDQDTGDARREGQAGTRAQGGPVEALAPYIVGEQGRELFIPATNGYVINATDTRRLIGALERLQAAPPARVPVSTPARPAQIATGGGGPTNIYQGQVGDCYTMPVQTNNSPAIVQQSFAIARAMTW